MLSKSTQVTGKYLNLYLHTNKQIHMQTHRIVYRRESNLHWGTSCCKQHLNNMASAFLLSGTNTEAINMTLEHRVRQTVTNNDHNKHTHLLQSGEEDIVLEAGNYRNRMEKLQASVFQEHAVTQHRMPFPSIELVGFKVRNDESNNIINRMQTRMFRIFLGT